MACQLLISGWFAAAKPRDYLTFGDDEIRSEGFRPLWWKSVDTFVKPDHVLVVDSAAPVKVDDKAFTQTDVRAVELLVNPGHSQNTPHHYCGFMAGFIMGLEYALYSGVDYCLYLEQDALTYGDDLVQRIEQRLLKTPILFGGQRGDFVEQSMMVLDRRAIRGFLKQMHAISRSDKLLAPELKCMIAASSLGRWPVGRLMSYEQHRLVRRLFEKMGVAFARGSKQYGHVPFGYGRERPIDFKQACFYFQHGTAEELRQYRTLTGF